MTRAALLAAAAALGAAAPAPRLYADLSAPTVEISYGYAGAELLVYGAVQYSGGRMPGEAPKIAIIARGPDQAATVREKARVGGVWINAREQRFATAPSFFAVSTTAAMEELLDDRAAAVWELGLDFIQFSPVGAGDPVEAAAFQRGLVDLRRRAGLYQEHLGAVSVTENILYRAVLAIPSAAPVGPYSVTVHLVRDGKVVATVTRDLTVRKVGFEARISGFAERDSLGYGLATVALAMMTGWGASAIVGRR